jgi:hypothetical protein
MPGRGAVLSPRLGGRLEILDPTIFFKSKQGGKIGIFNCLLYVYYDTYICMKTTIEIPDSLLKEARKLASREGTSVKALVIESLQKTLSERKRPGTFKLRKATFKGKGLQAELQGASWERIRDAAYEGRGA